MPGPVRRWLPLALLIALPTAAADPFAALRASLQRQLVEQQVPSLAVAVAKDGKIIWEEGFGWADRENRVPATAHTLYSLASISKPITATGLMVLVERGLIDLDRPINDYLGEAKLRARAGGPPATVRHVANHSSGLPLHYQFFYEDEPYRPPPMDETIRRYGFLLTPPGERYQYSNLGFGVLDYLLSRLSRKPYADFLREEVFLPLGLTHTSVGLGPHLEKYAAARYGPDSLPIPFYDFDHRGGSAIWSSAHDLVRFGLFHLKAHLADQKAILPDQTIDAMHRPTSPQSKGSGYGIGWAIDENQTYRTVSHNGSMGGVATSLFLIPSEKIAVAVLCNAGVSLPHRIRQEIISTLLPAQKALPETKPSPPPSFRPPPELAGTWTGAVHTYKEELPFGLEIFESGDVHAQLGGQLKTLLNDVTFRDNRLEGRFPGDIGTEDANRRPYFLSLALHLRGKLLNGGVSALSRPGRRAGNALTHWVELNKQ
jgi:CubicO group peptidase (beta-lactamase class C family)